MCGIVGYIGSKKVVPVIVEGLRKLEYRGYDSAGIAVVTKEGKLEIRRAPGKLRNLEDALAKARRSRELTASATRVGRRMDARPKKTRTRIATARATTSSFTTASSKIIWS